MLHSQAMEELEHILAGLVNAVEGTRSAAVGGMDGLLVERFPQGGDSLDVLVAEQTNLLRSARAAFAGEPEAGEVEEVVVMLAGLTAYTRLLGNGLFLLVLMAPASDLGQVRGHSERIGPRVIELLL